MSTPEQLPNNVTREDQIEMVITHFQSGVDTTREGVPFEVPTPESIENFIRSRGFNEITREDIENLKVQVVADYQVNVLDKESAI